MKTTLIALFALALCLPLSAQDKPKPDTAKSNLEWQKEEMCQFVFFAVLEGVIFIVILAGGLLYAWRKGALDWV